MYVWTRCFIICKKSVVYHFLKAVFLCACAEEKTYFFKLINLIFLEFNPFPFTFSPLEFCGKGRLCAEYLPILNVFNKVLILIFVEIFFSKINFATSVLYFTTGQCFPTSQGDSSEYLIGLWSEVELLTESLRLRLRDSLNLIISYWLDQTLSKWRKNTRILKLLTALFDKMPTYYSEMEISYTKQIYLRFIPKGLQRIKNLFLITLSY